MVAKLQPVVFEETPSIDSVEKSPLRSQHKWMDGSFMYPWRYHSSFGSGPKRTGLVDSCGFSTPEESQETESQIERWQNFCCEHRNTRIILGSDRFVWSALPSVVSYIPPFIKAGLFPNMLPICIMTLYIRQRRKRWALRSHRSRLTHVAVLLPRPSWNPLSMKLLYVPFLLARF